MAASAKRTQLRLCAWGALAAALFASSPAFGELIDMGPAPQAGRARPASGDFAGACARLGQAFEAAAQRYELSSDLLVAVARTESNCNARAVSPAGAIGIMQLMPQTASALGLDPWNADDNVRGGAADLRQQIDKFGGRLDLALAAYNAGPAAIARRGAVPNFLETRGYIARNFDLLADRSLAETGD